MPDAYHQLLDAAIHELERLRDAGARFVPVTPEALAFLNEKPAAARTPASRQPAARPPNPRPTPAVGTVHPVPASAAGAVTESRPALAGEAKISAYAELQQRVLACQKCEKLAAGRKHVVFGVGNINAELMFVGEAPGADEDLQGEPFVGAAGQLLTKIIQTMGLSRDSVYIANILKCRPDMPPGTTGNRKPTAEEMRACISFLQEQIDIIRPKVIVGLGATAMEGLLGGTTYITRIRGQWHSYRGTPLMPTYHPAYLLRNQALAEKRRVWEDLLKVMEKLGLPVSEKQRNYFLR